MNYGLLNLGSVLCGLAGWIVPWLGLRKKTGSPAWRQGLAALASLSLCGAALWMQLWYQQHLTEIQDWSALLDTAGAVTKVAAFLLVSTLLINAVLLAASAPEPSQPGKL